MTSCEQSHKKKERESLDWTSLVYSLINLIMKKVPTLPLEKMSEEAIKGGNLH